MAAIPAALQHAAARNWQQMLLSASDNPADLLAVEQESGFTTLHRAIAGGAPEDVIRDLLATTEGRQATSIRCREGSWTPLHWSCRAIATDATIMTIAMCNPSAISVQDDDGDNALHCALRNGASDLVLQTLIDLAARISCDDMNEESNATTDTTSNTSCIFQTPDYGDGDWLIHSAIRHEAPTHIVELLLDASPESIDARNSEWKSPLHLACDFERHDVIALLSQRIMHLTGLPRGFRSYLATEDYFGTTPVGCLWERYLDICALSEGDNGDNNVCLDLCETVEQIELIESIVLLITSAYYGREVDFDPRCRSRSQVQLLIQAVIGLGSICPPTLLNFLVKRYPLVLATPDACGRLPLHDAIIQAAAAAAAASSSHRHTESSGHAARPTGIVSCAAARSHAFIDSSTSLIESGSTTEIELKTPKQDQEYDILHPSPNQLLRQGVMLPTSYANGPTTALEVIASAYPQAATQKDSEGHLPLALAARSALPWKEGTECVFKAYPKAMRVKDDKTGLYPFMLAAAAEGADAAAQVDTIFQLLRQEPTLVTSGIIESTCKRSRGNKRRGKASNNNDHKKKLCTKG